MAKQLIPREQKQILPFAVTKSSNVNQSKTYFGWIDSHVFLTKIVRMANLNSDIKLVGLAENRLPIETRTIENKSPPLTIAVLEKNTVQPSLSFINFEFFRDPGTIMLLAINLFLWFALALSLVEHLKRLKSEEKLKEVIDLGQQHAKLATIGELASGIAHEINQPLATIETYAGLTKRGLVKSLLMKNLEKNLNMLMK